MEVVKLESALLIFLMCLLRYLYVAGHHGQLVEDAGHLVVSEAYILVG